VYQFPSAKEKEMFLANPIQYVPALGGDCVVCRVNTGVRVPGKVEFAVVHDKRAYLFPSAKERDAFKADPKKYESADVGLGGYCAVCVVNAKKWVAGKPEFVSVYDGVRYFFPGADEKKAFEADPAKFTPALEGDCVVCLKDAGKRVTGSPKFSATHEGRLYLFPDEGAQKTFLADPKKYASIDLANDGNCVVCAKMAKKVVPGKAEFTSVYKGLRHLFPSAKEKQTFDADPASFVGTGMKLGAAPGGNVNAVAVTGKTACAACAYGVRPLTDADSLGMAVVAGETVYVVEGGEKLYPDLFKNRFDGLAVELKGTVKKTRGKFVWIEPTSITRTR
jgi:YHS domain-containing protein